MAQLFNRQGQKPPAPPLTSPPPNDVQGQIYRRKSKSRLQTKIFAVMAGMFLLIGLSSTIYLVSQKQNIQQHAQLNQIGTHDSCGLLHFDFSETPAAPVCATPGVNSHINSYTYTVKVTSTTGGVERSFDYSTYNYFCTKGFATNGRCIDNGIEKTNLVGKTPATITMTRTPTLGSFCGSYQDDFKVISVNGNTSCVFEGNGGTVASSGSCQTGTDCKSAPPPTPTTHPKPTTKPTPTSHPTPTVKPSPTLQPTPGVTVTPTIVPSTTLPPSITPTACLTPGQVQNVKVTCANCSSSSQ